MLERLSDNLYLYRDICNVYVVKDGARALLIDFGSGAALDHLGSIGVSQVDWILHTHHHRDQCQGDRIANQRGIPIAVPAHERTYFEEVEVFWNSRQIYNMYDVRGTFFTLAQSVKVARSLLDYSTFEWGPYRFLVQPSPGHTIGSISLISQIDGRKVAFTGDLMAAPGKLHTLYDLQYMYGSHDGMDHVVYSTGKLRNHGAELACPSHGEPFANVNSALEELENKLRAYMLHHWGIQTPSADVGPFYVLPHVVHIPGCSNTWIIISDSGKALFIDYGSQTGHIFNSATISFEPMNRLRMLEHNLDLLRDNFGMRSVDVVMPSHYHDDHVNGLPYLQSHHGAQVWCYKNMRDILEHPHGYKLGCVFAEPLKVDRPLEQGEAFRWEEFEFQVFHAPGHADYHMAMFGEIDGKQVAFTGDEITRLGEHVGSNNIWRNHVHANSHEITGRLFLERQPELVCPGHGASYSLDANQWHEFHNWCHREQDHWHDLSHSENVEEAIYPDYVFLYPYQPPCAPGESVPMQVWYENIQSHPSTLDYVLRLPEGWKADPDCGSITVEPGQKGIGDFMLRVPSDQTTVYRRKAFTLDAVIDGTPRGQLAEAVVDLRPEADWCRTRR